MTTTSRWTLALVSIATAMLMLDIAVVNTAISDMGKDLGATLDDLKWVVDADTLARAARGPGRPGHADRRPVPPTR